jgi:hypothetical protein
VVDSGSREAQPNFVEATSHIGSLRVAIGFLQGVFAWLLLRLVAPNQYTLKLAAPPTDYWATQHPTLFVALALITALVPIIAIVEVSRMRLKALLTYLGLAALAIAGLAAYDIWRDPLEYSGAVNSVRVWPSFQLSVCTALGMFIFNQLLEHRERGFKLFAQYALHFEDSWMRGFQLVISLIFSVLAWAVLNLGALLFGLIHIEWFKTLLEHNWFRSPFMAMAFAAAIHISDVRPALLKGMRNVVLTLLSWLLPMVVALSSGFLVALCFIGLKPLWETRHAASILLSSCALTVFLLNAAYKDGDPATLPPGLLRFFGRAAGPVLVPLALLAFYAIAMRVHQYGWTPDRVWSIAVAVMALIYTGGYALAATYRVGWLKPLEPVNVCASLAILVLLVLLLTPLADPARLSVDSQISRLVQGKVSADAFDYQFLRFDSATYGRNALLRLISGPNIQARERVARMQATTSKQYFGSVPDAAVTESAFSHATIYPKGAQLPQGFKETDWTAFSNPECLRNGRGCEIYVVAYGVPGDVAVIVHPAQHTAGSFTSDNSSIAPLYQRDSAHGWVNTGFFSHMNCHTALAALQDGKVATTAPQHDDLLVAGMRLQFSAIAPVMSADCEDALPRNVPQPSHAREPQAPLNMGPAFGRPGGR